MPFAAGNKLLASELNALPQVIDWVATSSNSTSSSGSTEIFDAVLGTVQIVADGSTQYDVELVNAFMAPGVAGDHFLLRIRDGGAVAPTTGTPGTEIAYSPWRAQVSGGAGAQEGVILRARITPTAGTHIFAVSIARDVGTGTAIYAGARQLIARTAGPA